MSLAALGVFQPLMHFVMILIKLGDRQDIRFHRILQMRKLRSTEESDQLGLAQQRRPRGHMEGHPAFGFLDECASCPP